MAIVQKIIRASHLAIHDVKVVTGDIRKMREVYLTRIKHIPWTRLMAFPVTAQCNYRCNFCEVTGLHQWLSDNQQPYWANVLSVDHIRIFQDLIRLTDCIDFGGTTGYGEPLVSPHFPAIVREMRRLNHHATLSLTTNGFLLSHEIAELLMTLAPLHVTFSVHAATEDTYRTIMGTGYTRVIEQIRYFCRHATARRNSIHTTLNFGVGKFNYQEAEAIVVLAKELGIDTLWLYPYYKSPNTFTEDVSLYATPAVANDTLDTAYQKAREIGQTIAPEDPLYLQPEEAVSTSSQPYQGGCPFPFENFLLRSDPLHSQKIGFGVCNRIVPFLLDMKRTLTRRDLLWMWHHPVLEAMRCTHNGVPEICAFCKHPETPHIRSLHHEEYVARRDQAIRDDLARFQDDTISPSGSIALQSEHIYTMK